MHRLFRVLMIAVVLVAMGISGSGAQRAPGGTYSSTEYGYSVHWNAGWEVRESVVGENGVDALTLYRREKDPFLARYGFTLVAMPAYDGDAETCLDDHERYTREEQFADSVVDVLSDALGEPIEYRSPDYAYRMDYVIEPKPTADDPDAVAHWVTYTECRTLEPGETVLVIQTSTIPQDYEAYLPMFLEVRASVTMPNENDGDWDLDLPEPSFPEVAAGATPAP